MNKTISNQFDNIKTAYEMGTLGRFDLSDANRSAIAGIIRKKTGIRVETNVMRVGYTNWILDPEKSVSDNLNALMGKLQDTFSFNTKCFPSIVDAYFKVGHALENRMSIKDKGKTYMKIWNNVGVHYIFKIIDFMHGKEIKDHAWYTENIADKYGFPTYKNYSVDLVEIEGYNLKLSRNADGKTYKISGVNAEFIGEFEAVLNQLYTYYKEMNYSEGYRNDYKNIV